MRSKFKWIFTLLVALSMQFSFAQEKTVTGVVSGTKGPLSSSTITVKGTKRSAQSDSDGRFSIKANTGDVLVFSFVGFKSVQATVGAGNTVNARISEIEAEQLTEIVVTQGYKTVTKKSAVGSMGVATSKTIENRPNANVMNTLQGQIAGLNVTAGSGQPGAKSTVIIRGLSTINGNSDPLYVIDGFPSNSDNFRSVNPNDIASTEVLKDASAISVYGSRGANGVIIIKTRKGSFGTPKATFRYTSQYGVATLQVPKYEFANAQQLLTLEKMRGVGRGATLTDAQIAQYGVNTDWVNYFFKSATSTNHNFSIENNGKNINSYTSVSYLDQAGILKSTGLNRFTVRNNLNGKSDNEKFKYSVNTAFGFSKNNEAQLNSGAVNLNPILAAYISAPYLSPDVYQNSRQLFDLYTITPNLLYTPLLIIDRLKTYNNLTEEQRFDLSTDASYKITKDLTARVTTSGQLISTRFVQSTNPVSWDAYFFEASRTFRGSENTNQRREFLFNNLWQLDYAKEIGKHKFNVTGYAEYNFSTVQIANITQRGLDEKTFVPNTGSGYLAAVPNNVPLIAVSNLRNDLISYFGSFDYDYNNKYGFVATYRTDSTSRFIADRQTSGFWSLGGRWNIDEEAFMDKLDFVDVLKLRGSIGTVGNQRIIDGTIYAGINPPRFVDTYTPTNNTYINGPGYNVNLGDRDLRWETTKTTNIGIDVELFKSRLRLNADWYNKNTFDLYLETNIVPATGNTVLLRNTGSSITNEGVELNIAFDLIRSNDLNLTVRANGSRNKNSINDLLNGRFFPPGSSTFINRNGGPVQEAFVYPYLGVNPVNGNLLFEDINGNPTESPTLADRRETGKNRIPVYQGGFGFDFDYKGFFLSSTFTFAKDVWRFDSDLESLYDTPAGQFTATSELLNAWTPQNTGSNIPALAAGNFGAAAQSDRFLKDASYIRLRNLQIGYNVPKKYLDKTFMKNLSFTLQGENLVNFTRWQGYDPESDRNIDDTGYPTMRMVTLGLDIKF